MPMLAIFNFYSCVCYHYTCFYWLQAVEAYEAAVKGDAGHQAAALALAKLHLDRGDEEAGRGVCTQLLAAQPDNVQAQLLMVQLLSTQVSLSPQVSCLGYIGEHQAAAMFFARLFEASVVMPKQFTPLHPDPSPPPPIPASPLVLQHCAHIPCLPVYPTCPKTPLVFFVAMYSPPPPLLLLLSSPSLTVSMSLITCRSSTQMP